MKSRLLSLVAVAVLAVTACRSAPSPTASGPSSLATSPSADAAATRTPAPTTSPPSTPDDALGPETPTHGPASPTPGPTAPNPSPTSASTPGPVDLTDPVGATGPGPNGAEVLLPDDPVGATTFVLVHGGAWVGGTPNDMRGIGRRLVDQGHVAVLSTYSTVSLGGGFPLMAEDVACGVRHARAVAEQVGASGQVVLVGHSAGAHLGALVTLDPAGHVGSCPWPGDGAPDRLVGLAGVYDPDAAGVLVSVVLGGPRSELPDAWDAFDPHVQLAEHGPPDVPIVALVGAEDPLAPPEVSAGWVDALDEAGATAELIELDGLDHFGILGAPIANDILAALE